ncbi:MAG: hypothetical protein M1838_004131 [Thelocarpon superellum]|nr:MAG: hypothetical protein M1838_004131 [Thelocarpon superellum]
MASGQLGGQMQALHAYSACDISDALLKLKVPGAGFVPDVLPFPHQINDATVVQRAKIIGPASTVLFVPKGHTGDTSVYPKANIPSDSHWVDLTKPDTVVVISSPKVDNAVVGGIMASRMSVRGARGIVVQGRCRDAEEMNALEIPLPAEATTRADLNGLANARLQHDHREDDIDDGDVPPLDIRPASPDRPVEKHGREPAPTTQADVELKRPETIVAPSSQGGRSDPPPGSPWLQELVGWAARGRRVLLKYAKFIGPGFMVSVAYIDPGNYSTDVAAGATVQFKLLFVVLMSNLFAVFLQSLCVKLGTVTGLNLAENCKAHLPRWLNLTLYILAEAAIIATDIAEVIGSAIALNLLLNVPLVAGCAITLVDVLIILLFYRPSGSMRGLRAFELFVIVLVCGVGVCFCIQLSLIRDTSVGDVLMGYLPSASIVQSQGLYLSCGVLGATVMPHSLYLGSGIVQSRLRDFDSKHDGLPDASADDHDEFPTYRPSVAAIRGCLKYSVVEVAVSLCTFALFINSAILIVAGASLSGNDSAQSADLFGIHDLLSQTLAPIAGTIFALALLLSGTSAGIICTIAGQMVSEGALNWTVAPWLRRLITRSISITPAIIIAAAVGKDGLSAALNATQVVLSVILPFVSAPLIYFTCRNRYMTVATQVDGMPGQVTMRNHWFVAILAGMIWLVIAVMNVSLLVLVGLGKA